MDMQKEAYKVEAHELLAELETSLLELEARPRDMDLVDRVFRAMHTIKGSGAMFGFEAIAEFTHDVESAFDLVREGRVPVTSELVDLALRARDHIKGLLDRAGQEDALAAEQGSAILKTFRTILHQACSAASPAQKPAADPDTGSAVQIAEEKQRVEKVFHIRFAPHETIFQNGTNPLMLLEELSHLGLCRITQHSDRIPPAERFDPEKCYLYWDIVLTTEKSLDSIMDVFIFVQDACDLQVELIEATPGERRRLGEILVARGDLTPDGVDRALQEQKRIGEILVQSQMVSAAKVRSALQEQAVVHSSSEGRAKKISSMSVRVAAEKLDTLVDLVGELVTVQARLSRKALLERDPELLSISEVVERLTAELRDNTLHIRMLPIDVTFSKLRRLVRDLSAELGKNIVLQTEGGDTELDKTVIEQLNDPLVHILRNSIDHGIEPPQERRRAGKPEQGVIRLKAEHSGAHVLIHISDDGAGIDLAAVRRKAVQKGWLGPDAEKSEKELLQMIFMPGFSTAQNISSISGRGVGMDVVKRSLEGLRGSVDIASCQGRGTTVTLRLPLTLAIIDGLLVEIDTGKYVLPLAPVEECVELSRESLARAHGRNILNIRGQIVPCVSLRERFAIAGERPAIEQVVINEVDGVRVGLVVDRVIGEHQIVIKTMNALYQEVREVSGATILGDGAVALILDVQKMLDGLEAAARA